MTFLPLSILFLSTPAFAEPPEAFEAYGTPVLAEGEIAEIHFQGIERLEPFVLRSVMRLEEGDNLTEAALRADIKAIYNTGYIDNVVVDLQVAPDGRQIMTLFINEKPAIRDWSLKGNKKLDDDALTEVIELSPLSIYNPSDVQQNIQAMREKYIEKGYYLVEIEPIVTEVGDDLIDFELF